MRTKIIIWLCQLFRLDYVLAVKMPGGVMTKLCGNKIDLFLMLGGISLSIRKTLDEYDKDLLAEMLQNIVDRINGENGDDSGRSETESGSADS